MTKPHPFNISGLYAVTPDELNTQTLCKKVEAVLQGGATLVQYRNKAANKNLLLQQASALLVLCRAYAVPLIINNHLDLCAQINADGLHLGITDCDLGAARRLLGTDKIIGASCYNQVDLALKAESQGASYATFGACFSSDTKPNAVNAPLSLFASAKQHINIPLVGIGGIALDNAGAVVAAGADTIAVVSALFNAEDITETTRQFTSFFKTAI